MVTARSRHRFSPSTPDKVQTIKEHIMELYPSGAELRRLRFAIGEMRSETSVDSSGIRQELVDEINGILKSRLRNWGEKGIQYIVEKVWMRAEMVWEGRGERGEGREDGEVSG